MQYDVEYVKILSACGYLGSDALRVQVVVHPFGLRLGERRRWRGLTVVNEPVVCPSLIYGSHHAVQVQRHI